MTRDFIRLQFQIVRALYDRGWIFQHILARPTHSPIVAAELDFQRVDGQNWIFARFEEHPVLCEWFSLSMHCPRELVIVGDFPQDLRAAVLARVGPHRFQHGVRGFYPGSGMVVHEEKEDEAVLKMLGVLDQFGYTVYTSFSTWPVSIIVNRPIVRGGNGAPSSSGSSPSRSNSSENNEARQDANSGQRGQEA
ncbi:hypothetical protein B0T26DRAFT_734361 [Lasiosphaeria miniovina]|uniref:Uncharacterized protein n=1 Tax=Lasiosphaeria miniovina TaxID=1954250 RepID=A0AA39ZQC0_9PEZI|nr:uncharacterized protein B0T26DRAFT_734361 [Lasiosphaeria miniovina]KAK0701717.1 hypothetical protein B0T26DRAFT_734361 [Lasiosphaeria miniovina]